MNENVDIRVPVLIVGGSLVGLSASLFLGRLGIEHLLVEKHRSTSTHPRGRGNNVRTMEVFRTAGAEAGIRRAASVLADNHGILQAGSLTGEDQEWLFKEIDPGVGSPGSARPAGACAARTTWSRCWWNRPGNRVVTCGSPPRCRASTRTRQGWTRR